MEIIPLNSRLNDEIRLYSMRGFYCLHVPMSDAYLFKKAFIGKQNIVLFNKNLAGIINTNKNLNDILHEQRLLKSVELHPRLGILIKPTIQNAVVNDVQFTDYEALNDLSPLLDLSIVKKINSHLEEELI